VPRNAERPSADSIQRLFELSIDMLGTVSAEGYFTRLNPAWEGTLGWTRAELLAEPFLSFVHPDDVEATMQHAVRLAGPGGPTVGGFENRYRTRDGGYRTIEWAGLAEEGVYYFAAKDVTERHEADLLSHHSEALLRTLTANLPDTSVFLIDHDLRILIADGEMIRQLTWLDESMFRGRKVTELYTEVPPEVLALSLEHYRAALAGEPGAFEFLSEGLTFAIQALPVRADDDTIESALVIVRDVTERTRAEEQIARRARQQSAVAELGRFALESHDLSELMARAVTTATATLGVDVGGVLELDDAERCLTLVAGVGLPVGAVGTYGVAIDESADAGYTLQTGEPTIVEDMATESRFEAHPTLHGLGVVSSLSVPIGSRDEPFGVLNVHAREPRSFSDDEVAFLTAVATLVIIAVERHRKEQLTRHAALHDPLTGLPNRALALDRLAHALARRRRERIDVAVFVLDLDRFKTINDSFGHAAGDEVLLALAPRLTAAVRVTDTVARLGGDEFVVICPDVDVGRGVTEIAERLAAAVTRPLVLESGEHFFTVSTGIALAATSNDTPASLLGAADAAVYRAKEHGRGHYELFDEAMRTSAMARVRTEAELRRALDRGELEVFYQPVIDLATGRPVATEALVRWAHPERGIVSPLEFISIAEESGLIAELGLQVLEQACAQTAAWQRRLDPAICVSVNVSGRQAGNPMFPAQAAAIAERNGLRAGTLALEITETVLMEEADLPDTVIDTFAEQGLTLALDDFGTGYSSLSRLKRFRLDVLKIDRSFVAGIERNIDDRAIVKATIDMAHAVGLTVVAEGVETREQAETLRGFGCDRAQGFLYARPQPAAAITDLLAAASRWEAGHVRGPLTVGSDIHDTEADMADQEGHGDFASGERTTPQGPERDFAEGEERELPGPERDFAEGEEKERHGTTGDFGEGQEQPER
jgi:diguanylate cyclase (GGDEF)-like protein/PAS domain S-box-containing protein